jgi:hypothetical protein
MRPQARQVRRDLLSLRRLRRILTCPTRRAQTSLLSMLVRPTGAPHAAAHSGAAFIPLFSRGRRRLGSRTTPNDWAPPLVLCTLWGVGASG